MSGNADDKNIENLLDSLDLPMGADKARDLLAGMAAAPSSFTPGDQLALLGRDFDDDTAAKILSTLSALRDHYAAAVIDRDQSAARLAALRTEMNRRGLDGFVVPLFDEYLGEYIPLHRKRLAWLTSFTGSAGAAVVLANKAAIFIDGRYTLQVRNEVDGTLYEYQSVPETTPAKWIGANASEGDIIGFDSWLHTPDSVRDMREKAENIGAEVVAQDSNPVDSIWTDVPPPPLSPMVAHPLKYSGEEASEKRERLAKTLQKKGEDAAIISTPESVAWLLNIRGSDLFCMPVSFGFAILNADIAG